MRSVYCSCECNGAVSTDVDLWLWTKFGLYMDFFVIVG
jgi:hypothetical protein